MVSVLICFGLLNCFFGLHFFKATLFIAGFSITFLIVLFFMNELFIKPDSENWLNWLTVGLATILGLVVGMFTISLEKIGFFALGAFGGFLLGTLLYTTFLHYIGGGAEWVLYTTCGVLAFVFGMLGLVIRAFIAIITTSFIGSYLLIRVISIFAGGFPNEFTLA